MTSNGKLLKDTIAGLSKQSKPRSKNNGLLSKTVTCSSCGHSWKSVDGGSDPLNCHKCGGMVKMEDGGTSSLYSAPLNMLNKALGFFSNKSSTTPKLPQQVKESPVAVNPYEQMMNRYILEETKFNDKWDRNNIINQKVKSKNPIKLDTGRFRGAKVEPMMIDDLVQAAKSQDIDPWLMLSLAGRESVFGSGSEYNQDRDSRKDGIVSGWNVAEDYKPYDVIRFLADKKVPGIKTYKDNHGWGYDVENGKDLNKYLAAHPELIQAYYKKLESIPDIGNLGGYDLAAKMIKEKGLKNYNAGDPNYSKMVMDDMSALKNDKAMAAYMKSRGLKIGGMIKMKKGGQMIKRADGSYSPRGMWDNIRENKGSGKKPTKEMLKQERKIRAQEMRNGGTNNEGFEALPEYVQANILSHMGYGGYYNPMMATGGQMMPADIARARFAAAGNLDQMSEYGYGMGGYIPEMMYGGADYMAEGGEEDPMPNSIYNRMQPMGKKPMPLGMNFGVNQNDLYALKYNLNATGQNTNGRFSIGDPRQNLNLQLLEGMLGKGREIDINAMRSKGKLGIGLKGSSPLFGGKFSLSGNYNNSSAPAPVENAPVDFMRSPQKKSSIDVNASWQGKPFGKSGPNTKIGFTIGNNSGMPLLRNGGSADNYMAYGGNSVVDYLNAEGKSSDKKSRAELARTMNIKDYDFSSAKNLELLAALKAAGNSVNKKSPNSMYLRRDMVGNDVMPANFKDPQKAVVNSQLASGKSTSPNTGKMMYSENIKNDEKNLESGIVIDKRTNTGYVVKGGKSTKSFPVLTGKNPNGTSSSFTVAEMEGRDDRKVTPAGTYTTELYPDIYGAPGFMMNPISAFNEPAPVALNLATHTTYDPKNRDIYYNMPADQRYQSYGCINCRNPDMADLVREFPKSDTLMVLDPLKNKKDMAFLKKVTGKKMGGVYDEGGPLDPSSGTPSALRFNQPMVFNNRAVAESTGVNRTVQMTAAELKQAQIQRKAMNQRAEQQRLARMTAEFERRGDIINRRDSLIQLPVGQRFSQQNIADITAAGLEDARVRPDLTSEDKGLDYLKYFADEYLNPARMLYGASNAIASLPYNLSHGNKLASAIGVAELFPGGSSVTGTGIKQAERVLPALKQFMHSPTGHAAVHFGEESLETAGRHKVYHDDMHKGDHEKGGHTFSGNAFYGIGGDASELPSRLGPWDQRAANNDTFGTFNPQAPAFSFGYTAQGLPDSREEDIVNPSAYDVTGVNRYYGKQLGSSKPKQRQSFNPAKIADSLMDQTYGNPWSLYNMAGFASNVVDGINNRRDMKQAERKERDNYSTMGLYPVQDPRQGSRGFRAVSGTQQNMDMPNQVGGAFSMQGMNQKYFNPFRAEEGMQIDNMYAPGETLSEFVPNYTPSMEAPIDKDIRENYTPAVTPKQSNLPEADTNLKDFIAQKESGGDYTAEAKDRNGKLVSSAAGKYQFLWNTHKGAIGNITGVKTKDQFLKNPDAQEAYMDYWDATVLDPTAKKLQANGVTAPLSSIKYMIHFAGAKGAEDYFMKGKETVDGFGMSTSKQMKRMGMSEQGGEIEMSADEIMNFMAMGGEIEYLD